MILHHSVWPSLQETERQGAWERRKLPLIGIEASMGHSTGGGTVAVRVRAWALNGSLKELDSNTCLQEAS